MFTCSFKLKRQRNFQKVILQCHSAIGRHSAIGDILGVLFADQNGDNENNTDSFKLSGNQKT